MKNDIRIFLRNNPAYYLAGVFAGLLMASAPLVAGICIGSIANNPQSCRAGAIYTIFQLIVALAGICLIGFSADRFLREKSRMRSTKGKIISVLYKE